MSNLQPNLEQAARTTNESTSTKGQAVLRGLNSDSISAEIASSAAIVKRLEKTALAPSRRELRAAAEAYERIVNRYAYAATFYPGSLVTREALRAVHIGRRLIYGRRLGEYQPHRLSFRNRVVESFLPIRRYTKFAAAVGILSAILTFAMVVINPQIGWNFVNEETAEQLKHGQLWTEGIQGMSSIASSQIMTNNIKVSLLAFAAGITGGVVTLWLVVVNGAMLGGIFAALARYQMQGRLLEFIVAHGVLELSIIAVSAGCGLYIGDGLINPGQFSRREALQRRGRQAIEVIFFSALWLILAGIIEGYISPYPDMTFGTKIVLGVSVASIYWIMLLHSGRKISIPRGIP